MIDLIGKLFQLIVEKVPAVIAEILFSIIAFPFRPYRTSVLLVRFARLNKVPTPLFTAVVFVLFMMVFGFAHPFFGEGMFNLGAMTKALSNLSNTEEHKNDVFFVSLYALGLTALVGFSGLCIEAVRRGRYPQLFRDLHYVSMALAVPWFVTIVIVLGLGFFIFWPLSILFYAIMAIDPTTIGLVFILVLLASSSPIIAFALQMDRRWHRSRPGRRRRATRLGVVYVAAVAIVLLMPIYLYYLATALYPQEIANNVTYKLDCFEAKSRLYAIVVVDNPTADTKFLQGFEIAISDKTKVDVSRTALFDGLKEDVVLRPKEVRRFRLMFSSKDSPPAFADKLTQRGCQIAPPYSDRTFANADVEVLH